MTTIHVHLIGDQALLPKRELEQLLTLARQCQTVEMLVQDDLTTPDMMRLAEQSGAFDFWHDPREDIYTV